MFSDSRILPPINRRTEPSRPKNARLTIIMAAENDVLQWRYETGDRLLEGRSHDLSDLPADARLAPVHLWTPARSTRVVTVTSPASRANSLSKAFPYMIEETMVDDPDNIHVASIPVEHGRWLLAITAKQVVRSWLDRLQSLGLSPIVACPISLGLICETSSSGTVAYFADRCCARMGELDAFSCSHGVEAPPVELTEKLNEMRTSGKEIDRLVVQAPPESFRADIWERTLGVSLEMRPHVAIRPVAPLNLLQGEFAPSAAWKKAASAWRPTAALLMLALFGWTSINAWDVFSLTAKQRQIQRDSVSIFREVFADSTPIIDPTLQIERHLELLRAQAGEFRANDFLLLLSAISPVVSQIPGVSIQTLDYSDGVLLMGVSLKDFQSLDLLKTRLNDIVIAEWMGVEKKDGLVEAKFRVTGAKS